VKERPFSRDKLRGRCCCLRFAYVKRTLEADYRAGWSRSSGSHPELAEPTAVEQRQHDLQMLAVQPTSPRSWRRRASAR
jgi:hypothetical protein